MKIKESNTRKIKLTPPKTRAIDPEKVAKVLGAEHVATLQTGDSREGLWIYFSRKRIPG